MPLSGKGRKIMKAMRKQYGTKRGEQVFYASKNKGTIKGVEERKMSYLDKVLNQFNEAKIDQGESDADKIHARGKRRREAISTKPVPLMKGGKVNAGEKARRIFKLSPKSQAELHRRKQAREGKGMYEQSLGYAFDLWSLMLAEAQFGTRPGSDDKTGLKKGQESLEASKKFKKATGRQKMASTETIKKRLQAKKDMDAKIKGMFDKYKR